jgi:DNA repair exonuclease SbcCD ATPase subunit
MIRSVSYLAELPNGKTIAGKYEPKDGLSAIKGPNGIGKTFALEFGVGYALFGVDAVRGGASDYKKSEVEMTFDIKGDTYKVFRKNGSVASLYRGDTPIATGVRPVNLKIAELLGFGLEVFKVSNWIRQGEIEALSAMAPADRKRLIDKPAGLDALDVVADWCGVQRGLSNKEAEVLEGQLRKPEQPVEPPGYIPSADLLPQIAAAAARKTERDQLGGWLSHPMTAPRYPATLSFTESVDELQVLLAEHQTAKAQQGSLQSCLGTSARCSARAARLHQALGSFRLGDVEDARTRTAVGRGDRRADCPQPSAHGVEDPG